MCANTIGHNFIMRKEMQIVLTLQAPVQAEPRLVPWMAPSVSVAKVSIKSRVRRGSAK